MNSLFANHDESVEFITEKYFVLQKKKRTLHVNVVLLATKLE